MSTVLTQEEILEEADKKGSEFSKNLPEPELNSFKHGFAMLTGKSLGFILSHFRIINIGIVKTKYIPFSLFTIAHKSPKP